MPKTFDNGVWTSEIANRLAAGLKPLVRNEILQYMEKMGTYGATDQEIENALGRPGNTVRPQRGELVKKGFLRDSGEWRFTASYRPAIVWVICNDSVKKD